MKTLVVVPARGGSKGIPGKNIKVLAGKPLIYYTLDTARALFSDADICVSTDDPRIKACVEAAGLAVPFLRPDELSSDNSGTYEVLIHAIKYFEEKHCYFDQILLMQPTTPVRNLAHIREILSLKETMPDIEMIISVRESKENPYFNLFEENKAGMLEKSKQGTFVRRQDCPKAFAINGSLYLISVEALKKKKMSEFKKVVKFEMTGDIYNIDIDTYLDWLVAELLIERSEEAKS